MIPNLPDGWTVSEATDLADYDKFPQYRVTLFVVNRVTEKSFIVTILVPKIAVLVGEGLRYIYTALERKVSPELLDEIKGQIKEKLEKDNENKTDGSEEKPKPVQFSAGDVTDRLIAMLFQSNYMIYYVFRVCQLGSIIHAPHQSYHIGWLLKYLKPDHGPKYMKSSKSANQILSSGNANWA